MPYNYTDYIGGKKYINVGHARARQVGGGTYLIRTVVALVADAHERARTHVGVADYALAIALRDFGPSRKTA